MAFKFTDYTTEDIQLLLQVGSRHKKKKLSQAEKKLLEISKHIFLFNDIVNKDIIRLTDNVNFTKFGEGDDIIVQGSEDTTVYFLLRGEAVVHIDNNGEDEPLFTLTPGSLFGEMAFITQTPRTASITASKADTSVISFEIDTGNMQGDTGCNAYMLLYKNVAQVVSSKLESCNENLLLLKNAAFQNG